MTLAGELVLARNELLLGAAAGSGRSLERVSQRVGHVTSELQDAIMSTRMQSIGLLFGRFPRIVRDLAGEQGKRVELACRGQEVELDRTIIETIADPLTHLVRNAVSHGIETPAERRAAGKPPAGSLQMNAVHKAGQVVIEVRDDGAGVDPVRVRGKALEAGIHTAAQLNEMSKKEVIRLLFRPGFSTAEQVDSLSGRGVGLDVVHANITRLGGVVDLESEPGRGAAVRITLPLTLAIIPGLLVSAEGETFCIPQANLVELVRVPAREVKRRMERIGEAAVLRLRGQLLPLVRLRDVLGIRPPTWAKPPRGERLPDVRDRITDRRWEPPPEEPVPPADRVPDHRDGEDRRASPVGAVNVAVLSAGDFRFGLIVESLLDSSDIVVKPLGRHTADAGVYSGATILGDGRVSLILDVAGIGRQIRTAGLSEVEREQERRERRGQPAPASERRTVLVLWDREESPFALPLEHVRRIEKVAGARIQRRAGGTYMEYRNGSLPLCSLACASGEPPPEEDAHGHVVVFRAGRREAGILAAQVEDILEVEGPPERLARPRPGIAGSWILRERMTLLLDPEGLLSLLAPEEAAAHPRAPRPAEPTGRRVLVVEDSAFFLGEIRDILQGAGHGVLTARGGLEALEVLEANGDTIDLVVTDIEMPDLDGFGLTERIRANDRFRDLPVIAVTTVMGKEAEDRGRAVGIDEYMIKLDRERIVERSGHFLEHGRAS